VRRTEYLDALDRWFEVKAFPYEDGLSVYLTDVTARKEAEAALRESRRRYRLALDAAGLGEIDLDVQTGRLVRSPLVDRFFGLDPDTTPDDPDADPDADAGAAADADDTADEARDDRLLPLARRVHPDDFAALRASLAALADAPPAAEDGGDNGDGAPADAWGRTFRVVHPDGSVHRLRVRADVLRGPDGRPTRLIGVCGRAPAHG
jgi:PAS domain-containing protein